jgi:hypothetical protein
MSRESLVVRRVHWRRRVALLAAVVATTAPQDVGAQQKVALVLHHLVVTVDSATYHDIMNSPFLREQFATTQAVSFDRTAGPAIRVVGKYNYLQIMSSSLPASAAIVLASEHLGGLAQLKAQGEFRPGLVSSIRGHVSAEAAELLEYGERIRPAGVDSTSERMDFEVFQYAPEAAAYQSLIDSLPATQVTTSRFLARWYDPKKLLAYLTGATLGIPVDDIAKIARVLKRDGVTVFAEGEGAIIELDGFTLHLIPPWSGAGVRQLKFALTRDVPANPVYTFGPHSRLRFGPGPIAVWDFNSR